MEWLCDTSENLAPLIYTPTVGQACLEFGHMFKAQRHVLQRGRRGQMNAMVDAASRRLAE